MDKLERLLTLLLVLLETPGPLSAEELRNRIPAYAQLDRATAFHRAFERDKDSLREMGVPLRVETVPASDPPREGYRVRPDEYYLRDPGLEPDELAALHLASRTVRLPGLAGFEGLWKLGAVAESSPESSEPVGEAEFTAAALPANEGLDLLFDAIARRCVAHFGYNGSAREVEPFRLSAARGRWYLIGHDRTRPERPTTNLRVDRIEGPVTLGPPGAFDAPVLPDGDDQLPAWRLGDEPPVRARVLVDADHAPWAVQHLGGSAAVRHRDDGSVELELEVTNRDAFRSFVLTFLDHGEVVGPPELRDAMRSWLEALA